MSKNSPKSGNGDPPIPAVENGGKGGEPPPKDNCEFERKKLRAEWVKVAAEFLKVCAEGFLGVAILWGTCAIADADRENSKRQAQSQIVVQLIDVLGERDRTRIEVAISALEHAFEGEPEALANILRHVADPAKTETDGETKTQWTPKPELIRKAETAELADHHFVITDISADGKTAGSAYRITWVPGSNSVVVTEDLIALHNFIGNHRETVTEVVITNADWLTGGNLEYFGEAIAQARQLRGLSLKLTATSGDGDDEYLQALGKRLISLNVLQVVGSPQSQRTVYHSAHDNYGAPNGFSWVETYQNLEIVDLSSTSICDADLRLLVKNNDLVALFTRDFNPTANSNNSPRRPLTLENLGDDWPGKLGEKFCYWDLTIGLDDGKLLELNLARLKTLAKLKCPNLTIRLHGWKLPDGELADDYTKEFATLLSNGLRLVVDDADDKAFAQWEKLAGDKATSLIRASKHDPADLMTYATKK